VATGLVDDECPLSLGRETTVEPISLGVIAAALIAKALDRAEDGVLDATTRALSKLVGWVRGKFSGDASDALARVEDAPDSPKRLTALATTIDQRAQSDEGFRSELQALVRDAERDGVDVAAVTQQAWGNQNVQVANASGADIQVTYGHPAPN
jgi:hypothetical protein